MGMGRKELYLLFATLGVEIIALGVGVMLSPSWGWVIAGMGGVIFVYFLCRAIRTGEDKKAYVRIYDCKGKGKRD